MVEMRFDGDDEVVTCEGCGTELPGFLDGCPCCSEEEGEEDQTLPCPGCGAAIYEDAEQCPFCGDWVTMGVGKSSSGRLSVIIVILLVILALLFY